MNGHLLAAAALAAASLALLADEASATERFTASFSGFKEVGKINAESGAVLSEGTATLTLDIDEKNQTATYTLTFSGLSSPVTQAHVHFGKRHVPGNGNMVFLCTNLGNAPAGTPACPANGGTVTRTFTAADVLALPAQNLAAGDFEGFTDIVESNSCYGNIHTTNFPNGEIRGEVRRFSVPEAPDTDP